MSERFGDLKGLKVTYVGDGNNVAHSLMYGAVKVGAHITIVTPKGFEPKAEVVETAMRLAPQTGAKITLVNDPIEGVKGANVIYTDVWASMGQEAEAKERERIFSGFQINMELLKHAHPNWIFMHCLPAHRGSEVTDEVCDHPQSVIFDQAENRLHTQKGILYNLINRK
jgi:ornithine carbamoyltransferase